MSEVVNKRSTATPNTQFRHRHSPRKKYDYDNLVWAENIPDNLKSWVTDLFSAADEKGEESAGKFSECFSEHGTMEGLTGLLHGRKAIHESRLRAWDAVETRKHILYKVYSLGRAPQEILILGKLESSLSNGKSFEMDFAAQAVFQTPIRDRPKAESYRGWAGRRIALEAAQ